MDLLKLFCLIECESRLTDEFRLLNLSAYASAFDLVSLSDTFELAKLFLCYSLNSSSDFFLKPSWLI